jgi:hypothetical protein
MKRSVELRKTADPTAAVDSGWVPELSRWSGGPPACLTCNSDNHLIATIPLYFDIDEIDSLRLAFLIKSIDLIST